jgi:RNA polymerase sigma-70 factor (ECF subfamily)
MKTLELERESGGVAPRIFATTHWSVVLAAGQGTSEPSQNALETLCQAYWYPIYVYVRRRGYGADDAQDLTQEFFAQLIAKQHLRLADPNKGRFRSFLLATLHFFLAREWTRAHRHRRGGQYQFVSLDLPATEEGYQIEPADNDTPESTFQRQWALTVLKEAMSALERDCVEAGKEELFQETKHLLSGDRDGAGYSTIACRLAMTEGALRVAVHRLRQRYGELLRAEIGKTVDSEEEIDEELRYLMDVLSN